jgi:hypothetical protein
MLEHGQVDISGMNFPQLEELRTRVGHRVTEMREAGAPALREQWSEQAAAIGMTIDEIVEGGKGRRGRVRGARNGEGE